MSQIKDGGQQFSQGARRGRPPKNKSVSQTNSRNNSVNNTPDVSPNRNSNLNKQDAESDEVWSCAICSQLFDDPESKILECERCRQHYCISCLNKTIEEYNCLSKSDSMWFCAKCRQIVEKNIAIDIKIEERCRQIMVTYESRICRLEETIKDSCSKEEVRKIVKEEISKVNDSDHTQQNPETVTSLLSEINERKSRENNIIIHGIEELVSEREEERKGYDNSKVTEILETCKVPVCENKLSRIVRIGKFDRQKPKRPILVSFEKVNSKKQLFKNIRYLQTNEEMRNIRISNDLTRSEREQEMALRDEAKRRSENESGDFIYRVRGPPWARKLVRIAKTK